MLYETVPVTAEPTKSAQDRAERVARREAEKVLTRLQAEADALKVARTKSTLGALLDKWLPQHELDETTRMNYESQIRNYIKPALGEVPAASARASTKPGSSRPRSYVNLRGQNGLSALR